VLYQDLAHPLVDRRRLAEDDVADLRKPEADRVRQAGRREPALRPHHLLRADGGPSTR
jgi:hypothetical protein